MLRYEGEGSITVLIIVYLQHKFGKKNEFQRISQTRNVEVVGSNPNQRLRLFPWKFYPYCLVLFGSRNVNSQSN